MESLNLVNVYRGHEIESKHRGFLAVVDYNGSILYSLGDSRQHVFARSSMKPLQVLPLIKTGAAERFQLTEKEISLCCGSHTGEEFHRLIASSMLARANLNENALLCGTHIPFSTETYEKTLRAGKDITTLFNNCSGKHSGMILTAVHMGEDIETYYQLDHPVQQRILDEVSEICDYPKSDIKMGVDGCGVPVHSIPLKNIAYGYARMAKPLSFTDDTKEAISFITRAMVNEPEMVAGTNRFCTDLMKVTKGRMFGKLGAEAVYTIGDFASGLGIAVKMEDGHTRALYPVVMELLLQLNLITKEELALLSEYHHTPLKNARGEIVGNIIPSFSIDSL